MVGSGAGQALAGASLSLKSTPNCCTSLAMRLVVIQPLSPVSTSATEKGAGLPFVGLVGRRFRFFGSLGPAPVCLLRSYQSLLPYPIV